MKALKLESVEYPKVCTSAMRKMIYLIFKNGFQFNVIHKGRNVPLIIIYHEVSERITRFQIKIDYPKTSDMKYETLTIILGYDKIKKRNKVNHALIEQVNANKEYSLSGTYIVDFAITFLRHLGVKEVTLEDFANLKLKNNSGEESTCNISLSFVSLIKRKETFYSKFGFVPVDDEIKHKICNLTPYIQKIKIGDIVDGLKKLLNTMKKYPKVNNNYNNIILEIGGIKMIDEETFIEKCIDKLEEQGTQNTLKQLYLKEVRCSINDLIMFAMGILSNDYHSGKITLKAKFKEHISDLLHAQKTLYKLDLTKTKINKSFC